MPFLPITLEEMKEYGWDQPDFVYVTGDAYVDHPSFGTAIISRVLENEGFRVCIVSQPQNDFVFAIICEELGFLGAVAVIILFALMVGRGVKIALRVPNTFGALVAVGIVMKLGIQAALNIAVVTNSMPNTGISLPFFSSGGTSLALQIFEMGILLNISRYSRIKR